MKKGFVFFSAGPAFQTAYEQALDFLDNKEGLLVFGPHCGEGSQYWLQNKSKNILQLGHRTLSWRELLKQQAREACLQQGLGFKDLGESSKREIFRSLIKSLKTHEALEKIAPLLDEERFFSSLLSLLEELRLAGLESRETIAELRAFLRKHQDIEAKASYEDLWLLLLAYNEALERLEPLDLAKQLKAAREMPPKQEIYLMGFSSFSKLEALLLQDWAKNIAVTIPWNLQEKEIDLSLKGMPENGSRSWSSLNSLLLGYTGEVEQKQFVSQKAHGPVKIAYAQTEREEIRNVAYMGRLLLQRGSTLQIVLPSLQETGLQTEFEKILGASPKEKKITEHSFTRSFLGILHLQEEEFPLHRVLDLTAMLVKLGEKQWEEIPLLAMQAGLRKGIHQWKQKAGNDEKLLAFVARLQDFLLPKEASAKDFQLALEKITLQFTPLAEKQSAKGLQTEYHAIFAAFLRNSALLTASLKNTLTRAEWLAELEKSLAGISIGEAEQYSAQVFFHQMGHWVPPALGGAILVSGFQSGVDRSGAKHFYLEENVRKKMRDWGIASRMEEELEFLRIQENLWANGSALQYSYALESTAGKNLQEHWTLSLLETKAEPYPALLPPSPEKTYRKPEEEKIPLNVKSFSPTLFDSYKKCPFKTYAEKVLYVRDYRQDPSLDLERQDEGSLLHKVLEYFFQEHREALFDEEKTKLALDQCLERVMAEKPPKFYKGNEALLQVQKQSLKEVLERYLVVERDFFAKNPEFSELYTEWSFEKVLAPNIAIKGRIDRVDYDPKDRRFLVTDYKIGKNPPKSSHVHNLEDFQLYAYMDAFSEEKKAEPIGAFYASLEGANKKEGLLRKQFNQSSKNKDKQDEKKLFQFHARTGCLLDEEDFDSLRSSAQTEMLKLSASIVAGDFPVAPSDSASCNSCSIRPFCRIRAPQSYGHESFSAEDWEVFLTQSSRSKEKEETKNLTFSLRQEQALARKDKFTFLEASAGTGKTTVILEKLRRHLHSKIEQGLGALEAIQSVYAVSFTEKSSAELREKFSRLCMDLFGANAAAQAQMQVSTIHSFCRKVIQDFPLLAGVNPMVELLDERASLELLRESMEEFFLKSASHAELPILWQRYSRKELENELLKLMSIRSLIEEKIQQLLAQLPSCAGEEWEGFRFEQKDKNVFLALLRLFQDLCTVYDEYKSRRVALDFNDLERLAYKVSQISSVQEYYRKRFSLLLVDEFQDTNQIQRAFIENLVQEGRKNLFVVGDAKQSIYRFRAADVSVFQALRKQAQKEEALFELDTNYRSQANIVLFANEVTKKILPSPEAEFADFEASFAEVKPKKAAGEKVALYTLAYEKEDDSETKKQKEAKAIAQKILEKKKGSFQDFAILFRRLTNLEVYLKAFQEAGIPYVLGSDRFFYQQPEILDCLALLRALFGKENELALVSVLRSPWGAMPYRELDSLVKQAREKKIRLWDIFSQEHRLHHWRSLAYEYAPSEVLALAIPYHPAYNERSTRLQMEKFLCLLQEQEKAGLPHSALLALFSEWGGWEREAWASREPAMLEANAAGAIQILTVHASKGLEFPITILADIDSRSRAESADFLFYHNLGVAFKPEEKEGSLYKELSEANKVRELAESKRLLYVALTRAKEELWIFSPEVVDNKDSWASWLALHRDSAHTTHVKFEEKSFLPEKKGSHRASFVSCSEAKAVSSIRTTSITEIAAFQFCPEFHRLKYVQRWDDLVVNLWPKEKEWVQKLQLAKRKTKGSDRSSDRVGILLKKIGLERKERGIALHRVLERIADGKKKNIHLWLEESYVAQGADTKEKEFEELLAEDEKLLESFLSTPLGEEIFSPEHKAYPEIAFRWNLGEAILYGAMDRVIEKQDGTLVVVDYKSSVLEESLERYEFQVASYMSAIQEGMKVDKVRGYLVDLFQAKNHEVPFQQKQNKAQLLTEISRCRENYTLADSPIPPQERGITGKEVCLRCPYVLHCAAGREFVLGSI